MAENKVYASLSMDRDEPLGNIQVGDRRALIVASVTGQIPPDYNNGVATYPIPTQEVFQFFRDATLLRTITLNYTDSTKKDLATWSFS